MFTDIFRKKDPVPTPQKEHLEKKILDALTSVMDPDLNRNIVELGFIKTLKLQPQGQGFAVFIELQLTTAACPVKDALVDQVRVRALTVPGVSSAEVKLGEPLQQNYKARLAQQQKAASGNLSGIKNIIGVASAKGGVGKSTTTVMLAYMLKETGAKVGILDADVYGPSLPTMTGAERPSEMREERLIPVETDGIKMISPQMILPDPKQSALLRGPMASQIIRQLLSQVEWSDLDYLLIDFPPGTGDIQISLCQLAPLTGIVLVTTPQEVALLEAKKAVHMFRALKTPVIGYIETMSYFVCDGCDKKHLIYPPSSFARLEDEFEIPCFGEIPLDGGLCFALDRRNAKSLAQSDKPAAVAYQKATEAFTRGLEVFKFNQEKIL